MKAEDYEAGRRLLLQVLEQAKKEQLKDHGTALDHYRILAASLAMWPECVTVSKRDGDNRIDLSFEFGFVLNSYDEAWSMTTCIQSAIDRGRASLKA